MFLFLAACTSTPSRSVFNDALSDLESWGASDRAAVGGNRTVIGGGGQRSAFTGAVQKGTGSFVSARAPAISPGTTSSGKDGYTLNLVNVPIKDAAKKVLGDTLNVNYVVDPQVSGSMTIQTSAPVTRDALIEIFETALAVNDAAIVEKNNSFQIVRRADALSATPAVSVPRVASSGPGLKVQVIELQHIAADEMSSILQPISRQGSILRVDERRNLLILAGNNPDLQAMREAISVFDVDWMRGMSVALHPLQTSHPIAIAKELDEIFGNTGNVKSKTIRFIPNERLNAILVITSRPRYLSRAATWIQKLDAQAQSNEDQLFVYHIQNRPAPELAEVLRAVLNQENADVADTDSAVAPQLTPANVSSDGFGEANAALQASGSAKGRMRTSVVADVENNALLISTTARDYERIERILRQLDVLPTQVLLEAVIAEVTLDDELKLGVRWFYENGGFSLGLSDLASGFAGAAFPGFSWTYASSDLKVTLNALASITDVNIISSPTIMARNNQKAVLQVGDEVPIVTQQAVDVANTGTVINSVEMRDTGIILTVVPRVNKSGRVMLDIEQEVSTVVKTTTSGIDSPTIRQRKITTQVTVHDGESLALGGLIQESNTLSRGQVPVLGSLPLIGNAFKDKTDSIKRTELIIFIRPRVVRSVQEARGVTAEFRDQLNLESPINKRRKGSTRQQRDINRIVH
ncbi:type II secretion system secretin GspD [Hoeflea sp. E7-10]|uniref:Type II secretion system secretin GspD n=2 Tax=Hoeflea poritis TaxID=2993659 RepID=A0ABT4VVT9_9HYPH|nr:type II secretion system secretin GspD [Hoeflea poritis]MDA4848832.1 type II secretion system secretin GspD [Hoeflea poritis]